MYLLAAAFFALEVYHALTHSLVLLGWRLLPRQDLVKVRFYFLVDCLTVAGTTFLVTNQLRWLATLQIIQHLAYFFTWDTAAFTRKVISWSSLDWKKSRWQVDLISGTLFDIVVHSLNAIVLSLLLTVTEVTLGWIVSCTLVYSILYNPKYAWSNPDSVPKWVQKRIHPCPEM